MHGCIPTYLGSGSQPGMMNRNHLCPIIYTLVQVLIKDPIDLPFFPRERSILLAFIFPSILPSLLLGNIAVVVVVVGPMLLLLCCFCGWIRVVLVCLFGRFEGELMLGERMWLKVKESNCNLNKESNCLILFVLLSIINQLFLFYFS